MRRKALLFMIIAAIAAAAVALPIVAMAAPAPYTGTLKNNYGLQYGGQAKCTSCHGDSYADTTHGKFSALGIGDAPDMGGTIYSLGGAPMTTADMFVTLGYGTGLREYLKAFPNGSAAITGLASVSATSYIGVAAGFESFWSVKAGGDQVFDKWEYPLASDAPEFEAYCGGNCHNLGYTKGAPNTAANPDAFGTAATYQGWAAPWDASTEESRTQYDLRDVSTVDRMAGAGVQCENCHGTGQASTTAAHWDTGVMITTQAGANDIYHRPSNAEARSILRSDVCGQCHGSYKTSNFLGYTPNKNLYSFASSQIGASEIPTEGAFAADVAGFEANWTTYNGGNKRLVYRYLWPGGINSGYMFEKPDGSGTYQAGMKHVYYTEWALTGHSYRSRLTSMSADASMYQKSTTQNGLGGGGISWRADRDARCYKCHAGEGYAISKGDPMAEGFDPTTAGMGYLGVECSSCHVLHNAGTEKDGAVGMALREPEPGNNTICEDCHKDRRLVMDDPIAYPIVPIHWNGTSFTGGFHAAQGLMLGGEGMYDVPKIEGFMSNVGCEKCHMPATRADFPNVGLTRYEDRSYKRYSHSMKIVEPGQFGSQPWQDSCSPCHPGLSQEELTSYIEDLQATQTELVAEATAAVLAAKTRVGYVAVVGAVNANDTLFDRSTNNIKAANAEGSGGFHNPGYTQAGLNKAIQLADSIGGAFALVTGSSSVSLGNLAFVSGKVADGDTTGAGGAALQLLDGAVVVGSTTADTNGNFAFTLAPTATKSYRVKWARSGDPITDLYSGYVTIVVTGVVTPPPAGIASSISISTNRTSATIGSTAYLSGFVTPSPAIIGRNMHVDVKKPGRSYWTYSSARTIYANGSGNAAWMYKYLFKTGMTKGIYYFRAVYDAGTYDPSQSGIVSVSLR
jgi:hypothetical protein